MCRYVLTYLLIYLFITPSFKTVHNTTCIQLGPNLGFVEARIRKLPEFLEGQRGQRLPIQHPIHLHPVKFPTQKSPNSLCYFIGFDMDAKLVARTDKNVYLSERVDQFVFSLNDPTYGYKGITRALLYS